MRYFNSLIIVFSLIMSTQAVFGQKIMKRKGNMVLFKLGSTGIAVGDEAVVVNNSGANEIGSIKVVKVQKNRGIGKIVYENDYNGIQPGAQIQMEKNTSGSNGATTGSPVDRGRKFINGSFTFSSGGGDYYAGSGDRQTYFQFTPAFSYFVAPGLAIGGKLAWTHSSQGNTSSTGIAIGPSILYFFGPKNAKQKKIYPYIGASFLFGDSTTEWTMSGSSGESSMTTTSTILGSGIMYMLTNSVGLIGEANFQVDTFSSSGNSIGGNMFNILIGINSVLP